MALDFAAIESAILAWLVTGTGLPSASVILDLQKLPQLGMPYAVARVPEPKRVAGMDELRHSDTPHAPAGAEVTTTVYGVREMVVSVKAFTLQATGAGTARQLLSQAQTALALPGVRDDLSAAGLAFIDVELFQDLSSREGPVGQGRAVMDLRFRCADSASQTDTYIETVDATGAASPE